MITILLTVGGCAGDRPPPGQVGNVEGFVGGAAAEEPRAALVARDTLSAGGSAADAAVAAFFTMSVAYPAAVGLGGGGLCLYYDQATDKVEALDFLPARPAAGGPYAVPGALRGMAVLHARYGRLPWAAHVAPAESAARFGQPISRALARRIEAASGRLAADPALASLLLEADGAPRAEGRLLEQVALAATLSRIRSRGVGDFYGGPVGQRFVDGAAAAGGRITLDDLRDYRAEWRETQELRAGNLTVHTAAPPPAANGVVHELLEQALDGDQEIGGPAYAAVDPTIPDEGGDGEAALAVADRHGSAAACLFTMGRDFGAGTLAREAGILLAPADAGTRTLPSPVLAVNHNVDQAYLAAAAAGGPAAPAAVARVAAALLDDDMTLDEAMAAPRTVRLDPDGPVLRETAGAEVEQASNVAVAPPEGIAIGRVQALWCAEGLERAPESCAFRADRRGFGLAVGDAF